MKVYVKNGNINKAIAILNDKLREDGIFRILKAKEQFISKSNKRKAKRKQAIVRIKKDEKQREKSFLKAEQNMLTRQHKNKQRYPKSRKS